MAVETSFGCFVEAVQTRGDEGGSKAGIGKANKRGDQGREVVGRHEGVDLGIGQRAEVSQGRQTCAVRERSAELIVITLT